MRVAIVGCGSIGMRHWNNVVELGHEVKCYDVNARRAEELRRAGVDMVRDTWSLWDWWPEALLICTPPADRALYVSAALERRIPLFIEKPLALDMDEACAITDGVRDATIVNMVACNMRFHDGPATIKRWLSDGRLGTILSARLVCVSHLPNWHPGEDYRQSYAAKTGAVLDIGSHEVDLATWLLGPAQLRGALVRPATAIGLDCDGYAEMLLDHGDVISSVALDFVRCVAHRSILITGSLGEIGWAGTGNELSLWHSRSGTLMYEGSRRNNEQMYLDEMKYFLDCVHSGTPTCNPVSEAAKVLDILLEAKEAR